MTLAFGTSYKSEFISTAGNSSHIEAKLDQRTASGRINAFLIFLFACYWSVFSSWCSYIRSRRRWKKSKGTLVSLRFGRAAVFFLEVGFCVGFSFGRGSGFYFGWPPPSPPLPPLFKPGRYFVKIEYFAQFPRCGPNELKFLLYRMSGEIGSARNTRPFHACARCWEDGSDFGFTGGFKRYLFHWAPDIKRLEVNR